MCDKLIHVKKNNVFLQFEIFRNVFEKVLIQIEIGLINCPDRHEIVKTFYFKYFDIGKVG